MHYKKRKLHKLHSIPIDLCNNINRSKRLYLVSYSIPLSCMIVLLLGLGLMINPGLFLVDKSSAVTIQDEWVVKDSDSADVSKNNNEESDTDSNTKISNPNNTPTQDIDDINSYNSGNNTNNNSDNNLSSDSTTQNTSEGDSSDSDEGIMPLADPSNPSPDDPGAGSTPSISITVTAGTGGNGGGVDQIVNAFQGGSTVYRSHNVTVQGTMLKDYSLVLTGPTNLTMPSGASSSTSTISGAGGKTGSNLTTNTWGYAWGNATDTDSNMTYNSLSSSGTTISNNSTNSIASDKSLNFTKKLVFAAKFGDVTPGNYTANVTLSAVATPVMTMSSISNMQDMTAEICEESDVGQTATLKDNRSTSPISYKIIKMRDGTCWMAENLRLMNTTINSTNSDMTSGSFTIPASSLSNFGSSMSTTDGYAPHAYYNNDTVYGAYYNWYTATAGAGTSSVSSGDVSTSICPKGWKLPAYDSTGSFYNIINGTNGYKSSWTTVNGKSGYKFGYNSNDAFWPAAGYVNNGSLKYAGSRGYYWSRRAYNSDYAYNLRFYNSDDVYPQDYYNRYLGRSVRCVAVQ